MIWQSLMVVIGGALGSLARFAVATLLLGRWGSRFPYGTLAVNVSGCFLIGWLMTLPSMRLTDAVPLRLLLVTGFLGGFTTFSAFGYETAVLIRQGSTSAAAINILSNVLAGLAAVLAGITLGGRAR